MHHLSTRLLCLAFLSTCISSAVVEYNDEQSFMAAIVGGVHYIENFSHGSTASQPTANFNFTAIDGNPLVISSTHNGSTYLPKYCQVTQFKNGVPQVLFSSGIQLNNNFGVPLKLNFTSTSINAVGAYFWSAFAGVTQSFNNSLGNCITGMGAVADLDTSVTIGFSNGFAKKKTGAYVVQFYGIVSDSFLDWLSVESQFIGFPGVTRLIFGQPACNVSNCVSCDASQRNCFACSNNSSLQGNKCIANSEVTTSNTPLPAPTDSASLTISTTGSQQSDTTLLTQEITTTTSASDSTSSTASSGGFTVSTSGPGFSTTFSSTSSGTKTHNETVYDITLVLDMESSDFSSFNASSFAALLAGDLGVSPLDVNVTMTLSNKRAVIYELVAHIIVRNISKTLNQTVESVLLVANSPHVSGFFSQQNITFGALVVTGSILQIIVVDGSTVGTHTGIITICLNGLATTAYDGVSSAASVPLQFVTYLSLCMLFVNALL